MDSTGLLLLTNDGALANRLTHPRYGVTKTYRAELRRPPSDSDLHRLASGVELEDGMTAPAESRSAGITVSATRRSSSVHVSSIPSVSARPRSKGTAGS